MIPKLQSKYFNEICCRQVNIRYLRKRVIIIRGLSLCYLKVIEGQVSLSALLDTPRVYVNLDFGKLNLSGPEGGGGRLRGPDCPIYSCHSESS